MAPHEDATSPEGRYLGQFAPADPLPVTLNGYKTARLRLVDDQIVLSSLALGTQVPFDADAECSMWRDAYDRYQEVKDSYPPSIASTMPTMQPHAPHSAPDEGCTCGFYAYARAEEAINHEQNDASCVLLDVAISGRYIAYESGYRYAHQRVRSMTIGVCWMCSGTSVACDIAEGGWLWGVCETHRSLTSLSFEEISQRASAQVRDGYSPIQILAATGVKRLPSFAPAVIPSPPHSALAATGFPALAPVATSRTILFSLWALAVTSITTVGFVLFA